MPHTQTIAGGIYEYTLENASRTDAPLLERRAARLGAALVGAGGGGGVGALVARGRKGGGRPQMLELGMPAGEKCLVVFELSSPVFGSLQLIDGLAVLVRGRDLCLTQLLLPAPTFTQVCHRTACACCC